MSDHNVKLARHFQNLVGQCPMTDCYFQHCIRVETCNGALRAGKQASEYSICLVPYLEQQERNIQPINLQKHCDAIPPMFSREINWSEGFPNMVLSTEYSEAVNARYTFQPLWVSD